MKGESSQNRIVKTRFFPDHSGYLLQNDSLSYCNTTLKHFCIIALKHWNIKVLEFVRLVQLNRKLSLPAPSPCSSHHLSSWCYRMDIQLQ